MIDFEHVNILKSHLLFDLCGKTQASFPNHLDLHHSKQAQSNLFTSNRENPMGNEFHAISSTPQSTMPFSSSSSLTSSISSSQQLQFFNNYFNQLANIASCNKLSAFSPIDVKKKDVKAHKSNVNESHLIRSKAHEENEDDVQQKMISSKNTIKIEHISSRSSTTSSPSFSSNALYSPVNKSHPLNATNMNARNSEINSYSSPSSSSTSSASASSSSTSSSSSSSFKQINKRKLTSSIEKCSELTHSKHSNNENGNEHELDGQMASTSKSFRQNSLNSANNNNNNNKLMKNANGGIDWKITMLDGTQTVELNMADELGKQKKTHVCLFCGKIYNRKYGLKIHLRTHTGYKPLKCKVCLRPFSDPSNLNKHVRLHSQGETPYRCPYCDKILVRKRDLDRHILSRHSTNSTNLLNTTDKMNDVQNEYDMSDYFEQSSSSYVLSTSQPKIEPSFD
jgi:hypothetical protein